MMTENAPGACAFVGADGAEDPSGLAADLAGIESAYRRWQLVTSSGVVMPWLAQADICTGRISELSPEGAS